MKLPMFDLIRGILSKKVGEIDFDLTLADSTDRGHLSTNVAFSFAKERNVSTIEAAREIKEYLDTQFHDLDKETIVLELRE